MLSIRTCKAIITALVAGYITMVVINNILLPEANLAYVRHVMTMDTLPEPDAHLWRSITSPTVHIITFIIMVALEISAALLCWIGSWRMLQQKHYRSGQTIASYGLTISMIIWFGIFFVIGGEWFLAWQTPWGGLKSSIRVVTITGFTLIFINLPEDQSIV